MAYGTATLTGTYRTFDDQPAEGVVEIIPNSRSLVDAEGDVILAGRVKVTLDAAGSFTVTLPATDDATVEPATGRQYTVVAKLRHTHLPAVTGVELATGATVDVADVASVPETDALVTPAASLAQLEALETEFSTFAARTDNPHAVTKAQVGLGSVDNVSAAALRDRSTHTGTQPATSITGLADVATTGAYSDLTGQPAIPATPEDIGAARAGYVTQSQALTNGADQAAVLNAELAALPSGGTLVLPAGTVAVGSALTVPNEATIAGAGEGSAIEYTGTGTLVTLSGKTKVKFRQMRVHLAAADAIAFDVSGSFRCTWEGVIVEGQQVSTNGTTYRGQKGFVFRDNAGDNRIIDCDLNNLGTAVETSTITNYMVGCVIGSCWRGIVGGDPTGVAFNAGMSVESCTFVGEHGTSDTAVLVTGSAAEWWLSKVHIEKWDKAIDVGVSGGGARSFGLTDSFLAATTTVLRLTSARQAHLADVTFSREGTDAPADLVIDATGTPTGVAINLRKTQAFDFAGADFPAGWMVYRRGTLRLPSAVTGPLALAGNATITPSDTGSGLVVEAPAANSSDIVVIKRAGGNRFRGDAFGTWYAGAFRFEGTSVNITQGSGSPEGAVSASPGSLYLNRAGGAGATLYVKESGTGNTGWVAK